MAKMLELSNQKILKTMINMLRALMKTKIDNMQEQKDTVCREMKILRKNQKRNARDKKHFHRNEG